MDETIEMLIKTLHDSVLGIAASPADGRDALLTKSFSEFQDVLLGELEKAAPIEQEHDEGLYKGLGCVGSVADLASTMARQIQSIKDGKPRYAGDDFEADPCSDEASNFLDGAMQCVELALRSSVNDHVDLADDSDDPDADDGMNYTAVPNAEDPDNEDASIVLKSALPGELLKFAADPASLDMAAITLGGIMMQLGGVPQAQLAKAFELDGEVLRKDGDPTMGGMPDDGSDPGTDPSAGADPNDLVAQLEIMGRLNAACIMQTEHCIQLAAAMEGVPVPGDATGGAAGGGGDPTMDPNADPTADPSADPTADPSADPTADPSADPNADPSADPTADPADPTKKKVAKSAGSDEENELAKAVLAQNEALRAKIANQEALLAKAADDMERMSKAPVAAKAILAVAPALNKALNKAADVAAAGGATGAAGDLAKQYHDARTDQARHEVLAKCCFKGVDPANVMELAKGL